MASGRVRYPEPIDPDRSLSAKLPESIRFARLEKIRTHKNSPKGADARALAR